MLKVPQKHALSCRMPPSPLQTLRKLALWPTEGAFIMIIRFIYDERGMETLEYAVIAGLLAVLVAFIYSSNGSFMNSLRDRLQNAASQS